MLLVRDERICDLAAREALLDASFGEGRFLKTSERLREGRLPARGLALSAERDATLIGTVRLWNIRAGSAGDGLLLGPLAVAGSERGTGVGARLMREALWRAARTGHAFVLLVGDRPYYERFGFDLAPRGLELPGPVDRARFLALDLKPGALAAACGMVEASGIMGDTGLARAA